MLWMESCLEQIEKLGKTASKEKKAEKGWDPQMNTESAKEQEKKRVRGFQRHSDRER